ncbi:D-isomer specific 2-hydroxyacid dehydrogenase NAD-binding [Penicillium angulare]|uniref:D-isomer specific 2-hydroxyacid dehydrogenase NAD-binding n=1 Tax=Penicillium angulare TaxID=116970 RepID=A0A9W9K680_9EURO|nr:D-isomer specific 2-hydroxyacid dehydrogenase NAD-binding [Penicillium angulare]
MASGDTVPHIVAIEAIHCPIPTFDIPHTRGIYEWTTESQLEERVKDATVIIATTIRLSARILSPEVTPKLKLIVAMAVGTNHIDKFAAKQRGIPVCNCPASNLESVSEHAIGLYFSARRKLVSLHQATTRVLPSPVSDTEWKANGSLRTRLHMSNGKPPLTCGEETMGIFGYGGLGKRIAPMAGALGMTVLVAERKGHSPRENRVAFDEVLRKCTVLVMCLPRNPETENLISSTEFGMMRPEALLINVARGGIVDEAALLAALKEGQISGAATDVFNTEPAGKADSPLLGPEAEGLNLIMTPHLAWYAERTLENYRIGMKAAIEKWYGGEIVNEVQP